MLVFCHCPKTGGTSLFRAIGQVHGLARSYQMKRQRPDVAALHKQGVTFIAGHAPYEHYRGLSTTDVSGPPRFVTLVRDPVKVTLSLFMHYSRQRHLSCETSRFFDVELPSRGVAVQSAEAVRLFLERFRKFTDFRWDNFQVRFAVDKLTGPLDASDLKQAKRVLSSMDVVGVTEQFEDSLRLMATRFGWEAVEYSAYGVSSKADRLASDASLTSEIAAQCPLDCALVTWATARLEAELALRRREDGCENKPLPKIAPSTIPHRRFSPVWMREWLALASTFTRDDWGWWFECKKGSLVNQWRSRLLLLSFICRAREPTHLLKAILGDWRSCRLSKLWLVGGIAYLFAPWDLIPDRIPVLGHVDELAFILAGVLLSLVAVPKAILQALAHPHPSAQRVGRRIDVVSAAVAAVPDHLDG